MARWRVGLRLLLVTQVGYLATIVAVVGLVGVARPVVLGITDRDASEGIADSSVATTMRFPIVSISGTIVGKGQAILNVQERGGSHPVGFMITGATTIEREGERSAFEHLRAGDDATMMIDSRTGRAERIEAVAGGNGWQTRDRLAVAGPGALIAFIVAGLLLAYRCRSARGVVPDTTRLGSERRSYGFGRRQAMIPSTRIL